MREIGKQREGKRNRVRKGEREENKERMRERRETEYEGER